MVHFVIHDHFIYSVKLDYNLYTIVGGASLVTRSTICGLSVSVDCIRDPQFQLQTLHY